MQESASIIESNIPNMISFGDMDFKFVDRNNVIEFHLSDQNLKRTFQDHFKFYQTHLSDFIVIGQVCG